jgi:hypothetical protein
MRISSVGPEKKLQRADSISLARPQSLREELLPFRAYLASVLSAVNRARTAGSAWRVEKR